MYNEEIYFIAVAFIWLLTVMGFFEVDKKLITIAFVSNIVLFISAIYIYLKSTLSKVWIKYFLLSLICLIHLSGTDYCSYLLLCPLLKRRGSLKITRKINLSIWITDVNN